MKTQVSVGYQVFEKNQVRVESGSGPRKTLPENTYTTSEVSQRPKVWNMCLGQCQIFYGHRICHHFYHVTSFKSIDIVLETGSATTNPIPYPFGSGIEEQILVLPGWIQAPVPALFNISCTHILHVCSYASVLG